MTTTTNPEVLDAFMSKDVTGLDMLAFRGLLQSDVGMLDEILSLLTLPGVDVPTSLILKVQSYLYFVTTAQRERATL